MTNKSGSSRATLERNEKATAAPFERYIPWPAQPRPVNRIADRKLGALQAGPGPRRLVDDADFVAVLQVAANALERNRAPGRRPAASRSFGPTPDSMRSWGVLNAPPDRMTSRRASTLPQFPVFAAGAGRGAIETAAFKIFDADGAILRIEEDARRQRIVFDFERCFCIASSTRSRAPRRRPAEVESGTLLRPSPSFPCVRRLFGSTSPTTTRANRSTTRRSQAFPRANGVLRRAEEIGPDRFADHGHQSDVRERLRRQRPLHGQPSIPAVPGRIDEPAGQPEKQPPPPGITAILDALEIPAHVFGPP